MKIALEEVAADREAVILEVLERGARSQSRQLTDDEELVRTLRRISDDRLAAALLATTGEELERAVLGDARVHRASLLDERGSLPRFLGNATRDLVYNPLSAWCRLFDSRTDDRGSMAEDEIRPFAVQGSSVSNQGGDPADCPEMPFDPPAVLLQMRVLGAQGSGDVKIWRANDAEPGPGNLRFQSGIKVVSGGNDYLVPDSHFVVPVCQNCGSQNDINVKVDGAQAQVFGVVVGYFERVEGCVPGTTEIAGQCFQTSLRTANDLFDATSDCEDEGGRLPEPGELLLALNFLAGSAGGEHTASIYNADITNVASAFRNLRITSAGTLISEFTLAEDPYRCVFDPFAFN